MKFSSRQNKNLREYLVWLRAKVVSNTPPKKRQRLYSMNASLLEKLYFQFYGYREKVFIAIEPRFPVIKIIGKQNDLDKIEYEMIESLINDLMEIPEEIES